MSIKSLGLVLLAFCSILVLSCAGEDSPYHDEATVDLQGTGCLADTFSNFDKFVGGELDNREVAAFWDCVDTTLVTIERRVVGSEQNGSFKSTDLRWFVAKYFLKSDKPDGIIINDVLLDELMEIKRQFLGGSRAVLSRDELNDTRILVREFKALSLRINPYIKTLFYESDAKIIPSVSHVATAIEEFSVVVDRLGVLINKQKNAYEFERLRRLIDEINAIFEKKGKDLPNWVRYIPTLQRVKSLFLNSSESEIESGEWGSLSRVLSQGLSVYFRAKHYFKSEALYDLMMVPQYMFMYNNIHSILKEALDRRPGESVDERAFSNEDFGGIIESLDEADLLGEFLSVEEIKNLWTILVDKVLTPEQRIQDGLSYKELTEAGNIFNGWYLTQRWLLGEPQLDEVVAEMKEVLKTPWEYRTDEKGRLIFDDNILNDRDDEKEIRVPNKESSTQLNWERVAFDLVLRAYIEDPEERKTRRALTKDELDIAFNDIKPVFVQLGLIDADDETFANSVYFQSSLFMPRSNGDFLFDFFEMIEYAHFVLAGLDTGALFLENMPEECMLDEEVGIIEFACWRAEFKEHFLESYSNMPFMTDFLSSLKKKEFRKVVDGLEKSAREDYENKKTIKRSEVYKVGIFMQYIETLMFRFDKDRSTALNIDEGLMAVPLFTPQLKELVGLDSDEEVEVILTFMMKYGKPPNPSNPLSLLRYLHWRWTKKDWKISTDRSKIIQIMSSLSDFL